MSIWWEQAREQAELTEDDANRPPAQAWLDYLARERVRELEDLRHHWEDAYMFGWRAGQYWAMRRDNGAIMRHPDPAVLRREVRVDYTAKPVER